MPGLTTPLLIAFGGLIVALFLVSAAVADLNRIAGKHREAIDELRSSYDHLSDVHDNLVVDYTRLAAAHAKLDRDALEAVSKLAVAVFRQDKAIGETRDAIAVNVATNRANLESLAADIGEIGSDLDEHRLEDRNRRQRLANLFRFAEQEVRRGDLRELAETFYLLAGDVHDPEIDGDEEDDADNDDADAAGPVPDDGDPDDDDGPMSAAVASPGHAVFVFGPSPVR